MITPLNKMASSYMYFLWGAAFIVFAIYLQLVEVPFFVGTELAKHKVTELAYEAIGRNGLAFLSVLIGVAFLVIGYKSRKSNV